MMSWVLLKAGAALESYNCGAVGVRLLDLEKKENFTMSPRQTELLIMRFQTGNIYILNLSVLADAFKHKAV